MTPSCSKVKKRLRWALDNCVSRTPAATRSLGFDAFQGVNVAPRYDMDALLTSPQATAYFAEHDLDISRQAIYRWRTLGHIRAVGRNEHGQPLYRFGDLLAAEARTRRNPQSTRNRSRQLQAA